MGRVTDRWPGLTVEDAYRIQELVVDRMVADGDRVVGWKMGLTSAAKQRSMGVAEPIYGRLTAAMELSEPVLHLAGTIHPRVEPELAFVFKRSLGGPSVRPRDVWLATECVLPAFEIIDSRYQNFSFTLIDVVADNASGCRFYVGDQGYAPYAARWDEVGVVVTKNGEVVQTGAGAAVLGHPVQSVVTLVRMLDRIGAQIEAGMVVLTGGITEAVHLAAGDRVDIGFEGLGTIPLRVVT
ncbi:MAG: fumarylacetoacetate hydrolase family protein [Alicyclobacillaceae bacterium]|nr:fumarylacetoacetate hydrolase family protein [Alicyclobacillaceae bacterium]